MLLKRIKKIVSLLMLMTVASSLTLYSGPKEEVCEEERFQTLVGIGNPLESKCIAVKRGQLLDLLEKMCSFHRVRYTFKLTNDLVDPFNSLTADQYGPLENTSYHTLKLMSQSNSELLFGFLLRPNFTYCNLKVLILDYQNITNLEKLASLVQGRSSLEEMTLGNADQIRNLEPLKKIFFSDK